MTPSTPLTTLESESLCVGLSPRALVIILAKKPSRVGSNDSMTRATPNRRVDLFADLSHNALITVQATTASGRGTNIRMSWVKPAWN